MQVNTSTPRATQNFGGAKFYKIPVDMQEVMKANTAFNRIAKEQDIIVTATPRVKWNDPLKLRTPKADEKCYLDYEIKDVDVAYGPPANPIVTGEKMLAPLKDHVQSLLEILEVKNLFDGFRF
ncbi:MAG: hypothetical protein NC390_01115 [Fusobacterium sp.]|nr:hypothetical protein [Fusobacterium sp.]